ncbi:transcription-repair coupling factor [Clostridium folliculivorans]|uniref:Transcription-repair-coupling factor n=1 Tax=Clostridium folliculivorans TaxID=2886038 RepID=A0A9W5Y402_9CLOT|nr:transcription-repair coupling factor [Clostridium folliculivorans]GKU26140.1 transcription-repair-coupling factor [Clostridium folliculivorans]GKU28226.1 transcription-repair-coupling factor [Clostridium folliculivorans]
MRLNGLMEPLNNSINFQKVKSNIDRDRYPFSTYGVSESGKGYLISGIFENSDKSIVVITHNDIEAKNLYEDLLLYTTDVYYFPSKEIVFYNIDAISGDLRWARLKVLKEILDSRKKIIVVSIESFATVYTPKDLYISHTFRVAVGDEINFKDFSKKLIECGYERMDIVDGKGQFSVRGGILDIYPPNTALPYRIELFGDEIDSIRFFNLESQRSIDKVKEIEIFPAKEVILDDETIQKAITKINEELSNFIKSRDNSDKDIISKIKSNIRSNIENLKETWSFETIDSYLPFFFQKLSSFFDYFEDYIMIMDDDQRCNGKLDSVIYEFEENYSSFLERGDILPSQGNLILGKDILVQKFNSSRLITINAFARNSDFIENVDSIAFSQVTLSSYHGRIDMLIDDIKEKKKNGYKTIILSGTRPRGERLVDTLRDRDIESVYKDIINEIQFGEVIITFGNQLKGFEFTDLKICVISDKEVFGEAKRKSVRKSPKQKGVSKIKSFAELKLGDYVVHANHGVGVYKGIKQIDVSGHKRDYLDIEYAKGDKLYVPVDQLDLVQKYIGSEGKSPKISKLGSSDWQKAKAKVKKSINEIAQDLVKLYATRNTLKGHKFSNDTQWQDQFEQEFPYEETPDQLTALEEIKTDMESGKIMDRLLCGDVGYGKTEVALRAAFKAVMDGKQVALLVPTTILADQHYGNMKKRFSDFPIKIDMVSRFRTAKQQKETLQAVKEGNVDILVGTHRLVSKDIQFKDLGLLIVDEEQRFGVTQKEKIKNIKKNVDVLTLSATPIPRTLHMSLTGVRDISVIETPPEDRYPIQTYVVEQNDQLIRDSILREINRGGQVFFVYNRVEHIMEMSDYIQNLVPECKTTVIHGQMTERQLENEMMAFMNNEYNVLICTTIIETGIDMPNVNTIIVYDSDKMGLSQLYQLRGRVGRSNRIAYAYFVYKKDKILTEVAEKRLRALKDFTELGSGFKIAMRDLEIRGAGNMMGSAQHGHMATIGYDLYCRMLEDTIKIIKGEIEQEPIETSIDIKVDAFIDSQYIEDELQKIEIYKKIAAIESIHDYMDVKEELEDRFSEIPDAVYNLMDIAYIKSKARNLWIEDVKEKDGEVLFQFQSRDKVDKDIFKKLLERYKNNIIIRMGDKPSFGYKLKDIKREDILPALKNMVDSLSKNA